MIAATEIVLDVLRASPGAWLTMRQVADRAADRHGPIKLGAIATALVNLEIGRRVEVTRGRRPLLYRYLPKPGGAT